MMTALPLKKVLTPARGWDQLTMECSQNTADAVGALPIVLWPLNIFSRQSEFQLPSLALLCLTNFISCQSLLFLGMQQARSAKKLKPLKNRPQLMTNRNWNANILVTTLLINRMDNCETRVLYYFPVSTTEVDSHFHQNLLNNASLLGFSPFLSVMVTLYVNIARPWYPDICQTFQIFLFRQVLFRQEQYLNQQIEYSRLCMIQNVSGSHLLSWRPQQKKTLFF